MRELTRDERLQIGRDADAAAGLEIRPDDDDLRAVDSALAGHHVGVWADTVRARAAEIRRGGK